MAWEVYFIVPWQGSRVLLLLEFAIVLYLKKKPTFLNRSLTSHSIQLCIRSNGISFICIILK